LDRATDNLIGNTFEQRIRSGDRINHEFKAPQVTSGSSGLLAYKAENDVAWDRTETLPYIDPYAGVGICELTITFTGDESQRFPFAFAASDLRINGTAEANLVKYDAAQLSWNYGVWPGDSVQAIKYDAADPAAFTHDYQMMWKIYFYYYGNVTYRLKLRARCSCPGTLSVTRTI
jgi:hypothetical protein